MKQGSSAAEIQARLDGMVSFHFFGHREIFTVEGDYLALAPGRTRFGLPKMDVHFTYTDEAKAAGFKAGERMAAVLRAMGAKDIHVTIDTPNGAAHFGGTSRISAKPADGVADGDLRVHGVDNVYLVSNAVFPNIAAINPTLTLAALALRLGEKLAA
jgi:choline dehydrogenase-like flavoprotein